MGVNNSLKFLLVERRIICTFALELRAEVKKMSVYTFGIPFLITCSGEAAWQFYNPLQDRNVCLRSAALDGSVPANVALIFDSDTHFYSLFYLNSLNKSFVC